VCKPADDFWRPVLTVAQAAVAASATATRSTPLSPFNGLPLRRRPSCQPGRRPVGQPCAVNGVLPSSDIARRAAAASSIARTIAGSRPARGIDP
jgi:hypothetical protein